MAISQPQLAPARPVIHLAPPKGWMNDPNGLSFVDGVWHAYYQHNPDDDVWGPMHWRHATSSDLLHWDDHGVVLAPTALGAAFSGSIVVDHADTAGFGPGARIAVLTLAGDDGQRQGLAWSNDGYRWEYYDGNPILADPSQPDFRDPHVVPHVGGWLMTLAVGQEVWFYRSADLKRWEHVGRHRPSIEPGGTIECPSLVPIRTDAGQGGWLLFYGDDRQTVGQHGITMAVAGSFADGRFAEWAAPVPLDHGPDFYAAQSFHGLDVTAPPIVLGWMNSWRYANVHPSSGRRGVLTLPRQVRVDGTDEPRIRSTLAGSLAAAFPAPLRSPAHVQPGQALAVTGTAFTVMLRSAVGGEVDVTVDDTTATAGRADIGLDHFAASATIPTDGQPVTVVFDQGTVEVFGANGRTISMLAFTGPEWTVEVTGDAALSGTAH